MSAKIFKPRRGKASTMAGFRANTILALGEMFIEVPDTGVGTGACKMKIGDGLHRYPDLPYAMGGDPSTDPITITDDASGTTAMALNNVTSGKTIGQLIGSLKQAIIRSSDQIQDAIDTAGEDADGKIGTVTRQINAIRQEINTMKASFQAGCNSIMSCLEDLGYGNDDTNASPEDIIAAIQQIFTSRYNLGYTAGDAAGYARGFDDGVASVPDAPPETIIKETTGEGKYWKMIYGHSPIDKSYSTIELDIGFVPDSIMIIWFPYSGVWKEICLSWYDNIVSTYYSYALRNGRAGAARRALGSDTEPKHSTSAQKAKTYYVIMSVGTKIKVFYRMKRKYFCCIAMKHPSGWKNPLTPGYDDGGSDD